MTIIIAGYMDFTPQGTEQMLIDAKPYIDSALEEPGCHAYSWALDPNYPGRVHVFEEWEDEASLAGHFNSKPYVDMGAHLHAGPGILNVAVKKYRCDFDEPVYDENGVARADFFTLK
jgi:quinol monooxygenase YgiN